MIDVGHRDAEIRELETELDRYLLALDYAEARGVDVFKTAAFLASVQRRLDFLRGRSVAEDPARRAAMLAHLSQSAPEEPAEPAGPDQDAPPRIRNRMTVVIDPARLAMVAATLRNCSPRSRDILTEYFACETMDGASHRLGIAKRTLAEHVRRFYLATGLTSYEGRAYFAAAAELPDRPAASSTTSASRVTTSS